MKKALFTFVILMVVNSSFAAASETLSAPPATAPSDKRIVQTGVITSAQRPEAVPMGGMAFAAPVVTTRPERPDGRVLVVPTPAMKAEEIAAIREDLSIMSRIIERKTGLVNLQIPVTDERSEMYLLSIYQGLPDSFKQSNIESTYIAGFGSLFSIKVSFPLLPSPEGQEQKKSDKDTDNLWEQTKKEIHPAAINTPPGVPFPRFRTGEVIRKVVYDAEKVEELKAKLIESLKHATNIKVLQPDEWVIIAVTGRSIQPYTPEEMGFGFGGYGGGMGGTMAMVGGYGGEGGMGGAVGGYGGGFVESGPSSENPMREAEERSATSIQKNDTIKQTQNYAPTVMTIRAKKADLDSFATGSLTVEKLRQKIEVLTY